MTEAGGAVLSDTAKGFSIDEDIRKALRAVPEAWRNFQAFPEPYRRVRIDNVQRKRNTPELFRSRLQRRRTQCKRRHVRSDDYGRSAASRRETSETGDEEETRFGKRLYRYKPFGCHGV